jgi:hypothetical protein
MLDLRSMEPMGVLNITAASRIDPSICGVVKAPNADQGPLLLERNNREIYSWASDMRICTR